MQLSMSQTSAKCSISLLFATVYLRSHKQGLRKNVQSVFLPPNTSKPRPYELKSLRHTGEKRPYESLSPAKMVP